MKKIEVIKKDNKLQRLIIAPELKQELNNQKEIILEVEVEPQCIFCNNVKNLVAFKNKFICNNCKQELLDLEKITNE